MLEVHRGAPPAGWDDLVRDLGGTLFHSTHWATYMRRAGTTPWYLVDRENDVPAAAAVGLLRRSDRPLVGRFFRSLSLTAHPCAAARRAERIAALLAGAERAARDAGCAELFLESWMSGDSGFRPSERGFAETERVEFLVDLTAPREATWSAMKKDQRERVRHLEREGVTVSIGTDRQDLTEFRAMQESTQDRRNRQGMGYELEGDDEFYDRVHEQLVRPGVGRLFLARFEGRAIAGIFFHVWNGQAYSMFSGSTPEGYRLGAQTLLFWRAVERFREEGLHRLNRGGVPASSAIEGDPLHGLYRFKTRLGATPVVCLSGRKILSPGALRVQSWVRGLAAAAKGRTST
ncbi:MAG TPA: GNAT family N-acetyltransferase [Candidatus Eisenbacteria bacterium]|nr:GNAT family N-acetyltransferase [Candidatus Eisenbacteria bacterium]